MATAERQRLSEADTPGACWRRWGPYLSERQWGTVREDYSDDGEAWSSFTHDEARSRAYRWGEDGLAGVCDDRQRLCLALNLWNGRDPILKERLFGLTNAEGNHGEDVKECYFYLDATPTSSYLKMLYKYPQAEFPYADLIGVNGALGKTDPEYELLDTGVFDESRYFDVVIEYAKAAPEDLLLQVTVHNRGPEDAELHVLPTLWFRHTWSWAGGAERPSLHTVQNLRGISAVRAEHSELGTRWLYTDREVPVLVTENETNNERVFGSANETPYVKDGIDRAVVDMAFAKQQLRLLLDRRYLHPNGQLSAYEWNFSDVNPPVHAWATLFVYQLDKAMTGQADRVFLEGSFQELMKNFGWWLNRKDADDRNIFQGGFLGLDNIGVFDRSAPLPGGGRIDQADGTAWMALYCENMVQIALELARDNPLYLEQAQALLENWSWIAAATNHVGPDGISLWDEEDGFFYDVLRDPDGRSTPLKVRSIVGLMPLAAATAIDAGARTEFPGLVQGAADFLARHPVVTAALPGHGQQATATAAGPVLFALFDETRLRRILARMLDEEEFLGPHGIRSVSRWHAQHPYTIVVNGQAHGVGYLPAESDTGMFGGNSNWRGPVWFPINVMLIRALLNLYLFYGDGFTVECPTGSGRQLNLKDVAREISDRLTGTFLADGDGRRPVHGGQPILQGDPHWRDLLLFYEYFHGDNGAGIGASHQTGWTGTVALLPLLFRGDTIERMAQWRGSRPPAKRKPAATGRRPAAGRRTTTAGTP
jgi:hypothetical protein